jgi:putative transposase
MRYPIVKRSVEPSVRRLCKVLGVSVSGYYAWLSRSESQRQREDRRVLERIEAVYVGSKKRYGSPRVHRELLRQGEAVGRKRVARLMRDRRLVGRKRSQVRRCESTSCIEALAGNELNRCFQVESLNTIWLGDITYLRTLEGWLYLAVVLDLCSRRIVGWSMSSAPNAELTGSALRMAVQHRRPPVGLLHHSDQGCQYTASSYQETLAKYGLKVSLSRKGNCWDNAPIESFFSSLKEELGDTFMSRNQARKAIFEYIEVFYNRTRIHSSLGYLSPDEYELQLQHAA